MSTKLVELSKTIKKAQDYSWTKRLRLVSTSNWLRHFRRWLIYSGFQLGEVHVLRE